ERIQALCAIPVPTNAGELQQFICATNLLRESITEYAQTVHPLQQCLTRALDGKSKKKRIASGIQISLTDDEVKAFEAVKTKLRSAIELAHPRDDATMCLFTDASDTGWSIIVTQVLGFDADVPIQDQQHQMLVCQSGMFTGAQLNWSVIEKEAYPIARACDKLNYLLMRPDGFRMYCDHENLIQVFAPHAEWKTYQRQKLTRWAAIIGGYRYVIEHIKGIDNLWADLMSRWGQDRPAAVTTNRAKVRRGHGWSKKRKATTAVASPQGANEIPEVKTGSSGPQRWTLAGRRPYRIPTEATSLIQRILIVAHCGSMGHRGEAALIQHVQRKFQVDKLHQRAKEFIAACLLCPHVKGGRVLHRPYAPRWHATKPNEGLHFDYLYMGPSKNGPKYVLVLKDDLSHYCELVACDAPTSQVCVDALAAWWSRHSMPLVWISDQGSHFKNAVMKALAHKFKAEHEFTLAYCPLRNGTVERLNRDILQVMRVLLMEYKLADHQWDYLLPTSPMEVFQGREPTTIMDLLLDSEKKVVEAQVDWSQDNIQKTLFKLQESMHQLHKEIVEQNHAKQDKARERTSQYPVCNADRGDYVLWSRVDEAHHPKLLLTWVGPYRVVEVNEFSARIEHLITKEQRDAHMSRLKMYAESSFEVTDEILEHVADQGILLKVERIESHKFDKTRDCYYMLVHWEGFEAIEASWEDVTQLLRDCPAVVHAYV
ncbi:hypothetical protein LEN26_018896, partial [Aphanomyces euteiches]